MISLKEIRVVGKEIPYTGAELSPHFLLKEFGCRGSSIVAFVGPCFVQTEKLVDWEDKLSNDFIKAEKMLHFIGEFFGAHLSEGVFLQRLFMASLLELLREKVLPDVKMRREGDDLYIECPGTAERKLSVSIVTASPVSILLHVGINIIPTGAPVPAIGLQELKIDPKELATAQNERFQEELDSIEWACAKVMPV